MKLDSLDVTGYKNQPVPNTLITQPAPTRHLGIILPGYRHSVDMPDLHYAARILLDERANVLRVEYAYTRTDFMEQPEAERGRWIAGDVFAVCNAALSDHSYEKITLVGKSLGTIAMAHLLGDSRFQEATCVWSTPLLTLSWLCSRIEQIRPRSLFIMGTADAFYKPEILKQLEDTTKGTSCIIDGADHGLEIPGDVPKSLSALKQIVEALQEFLDKDAQAA